jgi:hypothetical protein
VNERLHRGLGSLAWSPDHLFLEGDLEPEPDVVGVPCVTGGPGDMPDGACTVFPPGPGSGIALRAAGDGAAGVAGANPLPEEPGAIVAGFGDWALTYDGGRAARAQTNRPARIMDRSKFPSPCLSTCMLAASFPSGVDVSHHNPACTARQAPAGRGRIAWQDGRADRRNASVLPPRPLEAGVPTSVAGSTLTAR